MAWDFIKTSRKSHTCSNCGTTIHKGDSYYRNGNMVRCKFCCEGGRKSSSKRKAGPVKTSNSYSPITYKICGILMKILAVLAFVVFGLPFAPIGLFVAGVIAFFMWKLGAYWSRISKVSQETKRVTTSEVVEATNKKDFDKAKVVCVDVETTGLSQTDDEILQLSIIDGNYKVLFNEYIKPSRKKEWPEAQKVHGISPEHVKDLPTIKEHLTVLNKIFADAEIIVGYNIERFDAGFISAAGIHIPTETYYYDVMLKFASIYGEWSEYWGDYKYQKLKTCADYFGYDWGADSAHDSLSDVKATMFCFENMISMLQ